MMKRSVLLALSLLALTVASGFAQSKTSLNIICNQPGAQVFINGKPAGYTTPNFSFLVPAGKVQVRVQKNGFQTFETIVQATNKPITLNVNLLPIGAQQPPPQPVQGSISVNANIPGADVYINGANVGRAPLNYAVPANGTYSVQVRAPGYNDFSTNVTVSGPVQVNATLTPQIINYSISINSNVQGAEILINGNRAGTTPFSAQVPAGSYTVLVRAPGYFDFTQNVVVNGPIQVNATLQGMTYQLSVDAANYRGADVFINGNQAGKTPFVGMLQPGTYSVVVRAPGFSDYAATATMNGPQNIVAALQPAAASWQIALSEAYTNKDLKGGHWSHIQIYVDGALQKAPSGQVLAGRHVIRLVSGGLSVETTVEFQPGRTYTFEPVMGLTVK
jgi:hypothetical protein